MSVPDPLALWAARAEVRRAYVAIQRLRVDPTLKELLDRLDALCCGLTAEIERIEPEMALRSVRVVEIREGAPT